MNPSEGRHRSCLRRLPAVRPPRQEASPRWARLLPFVLSASLASGCALYSSPACGPPRQPRPTPARLIPLRARARAVHTSSHTLTLGVSARCALQRRLRVRTYSLARCGGRA
jgi:hypothetical protein